MSTIIEDLNWRYATKKFDYTKKISDEDKTYIKEAIRLSASSYGLQPYKVFIVENPAIKQKLLPAAYGQNQIIDADLIVVFASYKSIGAIEVDAYMEIIASTRNVPLTALQGFADYMKGNIAKMTDEQKVVWAAKQTYIALGNLLNAAAELKIDTTPMEGFNPEMVNEILGLTNLNLNAALIATLGYRHEADATQHLKKVRKSTDDLFITI